MRTRAGPKSKLRPERGDIDSTMHQSLRAAHISRTHTPLTHAFLVFDHVPAMARLSTMVSTKPNQEEDMCAHGVTVTVWCFMACGCKRQRLQQAIRLPCKAGAEQVAPRMQSVHIACKCRCRCRCNLKGLDHLCSIV